MSGEDKGREVKVIHSFCSDMLHLIIALKSWLHLYTWEAYQSWTNWKKAQQLEMYMQFNFIYLPQWFPKKTLILEVALTCSRNQASGRVQQELPSSACCPTVLALPDQRCTHSTPPGGCGAEIDKTFNIRKKLIRSFLSVAVLKVTLLVNLEVVTVEASHYKVRCGHFLNKSNNKLRVAWDTW